MPRPQLCLVRVHHLVDAHRDEHFISLLLMAQAWTCTATEVVPILIRSVYTHTTSPTYTGLRNVVAS